MRKLTQKDVSTALSWARGEVSTTEMIKKYGNPSSAYINLARSLAEYVKAKDAEETSISNQDLGEEDPRVEDR